MKVLVVLSLLALVAAKPQLIFSPYSTPLVTPTVKAGEDTPDISTYTASYPYAGFPFMQAALPYNYNNFPYSYNHFSPFVTAAAAKPAETTAEITRAKRSADPEPEADPALVYTTGFTSPAVSTTGASYQFTGLPAVVPTTGLNYPYTGVPAAANTYTYPQTLPYTGFPYAGVAPYTGLTPYSGLTPFSTVSPYTTFPFFAPVTSTAAKATAEEGTEVVRSKRSADPEADPQVLTTGIHGFTYPAVNTRTLSSAFGYTTIPRVATTYSALPTTYANAYNPSIFTSSIPYTYGTYPAGTTYRLA